MGAIPYDDDSFQGFVVFFHNNIENRAPLYGYFLGDISDIGEYQSAFPCCQSKNPVYIGCCAYSGSFNGYRYTDERLPTVVRNFAGCGLCLCGVD